MNKNNIIHKIKNFLSTYILSNFTNCKKENDKKLTERNILYPSKLNKLNLSMIFFCILLVSCSNIGKTKKHSKEDSLNKYSTAIPVIFDTDIQGDYDDVGALAMIHAFADNGKIKLLATMASNKSPLVVPTIEIINTYFNRPEIPIGAIKTEGATQDSRDLHWPDSLIAHFPHTYKNNNEAPDAVTLYRKILSHQTDSSVTIISVGFLTNLKNLLLSKPDSISSLNGKELVARKVKLWVAMGGSFPEKEEKRIKETNIKRDSTSSKYTIDNWPTPIIFSGFEIGLKIKTGLRLIKNEKITNSPVKMAYAINIAKRAYDKGGRRSWDQTAVLVAINGFNPYFGYKTGWFVTNSDGSNNWIDDSNGKHKYLVQKMSPDSVAHVIEDLMMHKPLKSKSSKR